jgi:hypothetical protein
MNILLGIALIIMGVWMAIVQAKKLVNGKPDNSGAIGRLIFIGIVCIVCGIIVIVQHI